MGDGLCFYCLTLYIEIWGFVKTLMGVMVILRKCSWTKKNHSLVRVYTVRYIDYKFSILSLSINDIFLNVRKFEQNPYGSANPVITKYVKSYLEWSIMFEIKNNFGRLFSYVYWPIASRNFGGVKTLMGLLVLWRSRPVSIFFKLTITPLYCIVI